MKTSNRNNVNNTGRGKTSALINTTIGGKFTEEERNFLRTAMADPNVQEPTGVPDSIVENTVVKKIVQEYVLNMNDYNENSASQVDIISFPWLRKQAFNRCTINRETEVLIAGDSELVTGGVGIYVNQEDKSPFAGDNANFELPYNTTGSVSSKGFNLNVDDQYLGGRCRMVGRSIKVVNEGPPNYQSGTVKVWKQTIPPTNGNYIWVESSIKMQNQLDAQVARVRLDYDQEVYDPIPATNQQMQNLRGTKLIGHAKDGVFMIDAVNFQNSTTAPVRRDIIFDGNISLTNNPVEAQPGHYNGTTANTRSSWVSGRLVAAQETNWKDNATDVEGTVDGQNPRNYFMGNEIRGIRFSGLNLGVDGAPGPAVLRIVVTTFIEQIPSNRAGDMTILAKPSPNPNPKVLDFLSEMQQKLDFAWPAAWNGLGKVTKIIVKALETKLPENRFTKAFDRSGLSKAVSKALLQSNVLKILPGVSTGQSVARYADAVKRGKDTKGAKDALKQELGPVYKAGKTVVNKVGKEFVKTQPPLHAAQLVYLWNSKHGSSNWPTSKERKKWATEAYSFHLKNKNFRFPPQMWEDVMREMNKPAGQPKQ